MHGLGKSAADLCLSLHCPLLCRLSRSLTAQSLCDAPEYAL